MLDEGSAALHPAQCGSVTGWCTTPSATSSSRGFERLFIPDSYANRVGKGRIGPSIGCKSFNFKNIEIIAV